jgi:transcriptional regulator GlxA family with amidase domain
MKRRVIFVLFPHCETLDFAGPAHAFYEASAFGDIEYVAEYCAETPTVKTAQGLEMSSLAPLPEVNENDCIFIPGFPLARLPKSHRLISWLQDAAASGARIASVCTGSFLLGAAGLLDGKRCTTHWRRLGELREQCPLAKVVGDRLFVEDERLITSAGIAAGIDMSLSMIEQDAGPVVASAVAREMVVYIRRDGAQRQESVYLDYLGHLNPTIHHVQQHIAQYPERSDNLEALARRFDMSARNLSRAFRKATGISVTDFRSRVRIERARMLLYNPAYSVEQVAGMCGFADARQLRRLIGKRYGRPPTQLRALR